MGMHTTAAHVLLVVECVCPHEAVAVSKDVEQLGHKLRDLAVRILAVHQHTGTLLQQRQNQAGRTSVVDELLTLTVHTQVGELHLFVVRDRKDRLQRRVDVLEVALETVVEVPLRS